MGSVLCQRHYTLQLLDVLHSLLPNQPQFPWTPKYTYLLQMVIYYLMFPSIENLLVVFSTLLSQPDITFVVHKLSQFLSQPRAPHLKDIHHLLRYLKSHLGPGLFFPSESSLQLRAFSDADWASCSDLRKSITSFCIFFFCDALISWKARK